MKLARGQGGGVWGVVDWDGGSAGGHILCDLSSSLTGQWSDGDRGRDMYIYSGGTSQWASLQGLVVREGSVKDVSGGSKHIAVFCCGEGRAVADGEGEGLVRKCWPQ